MQVLLYTKDAELQPDDAKRLREAGVVPVKVADMSVVRLMSCEALPIGANEMLRAAMAGLMSETGSVSDAMRTEFVSQLRDAIDIAMAPATPERTQP